MIAEDYCSYEVAKLLKDKGFNDPFTHTFINKNNVKFDCSSSGVVPKETIACPTHQMAMNWLREKGIECVVIPIWNTPGKQYRSYVLSDLGDRNKDNYDSYSDNISYKEAVEAALKYCLEKIIK